LDKNGIEKLECWQDTLAQSIGDSFETIPATRKEIKVAQFQRMPKMFIEAMKYF
jgi:hypothetical protein